MVQLLKNSCIKTICPRQWNHFNVITFRNNSISFSRAFSVYKGKGAVHPRSALTAQPSAPHRFSAGSSIQTWRTHSSSGRAEPSCPVLLFATQPLLCKWQHNVFMTGSFLIIFSFSYLLEVQHFFFFFVAGVLYSGPLVVRKGFCTHWIKIVLIYT